METTSKLFGKQPGDQVPLYAPDRFGGEIQISFVHLRPGMAGSSAILQRIGSCQLVTDRLNRPTSTP